MNAIQCVPDDIISLKRFADLHPARTQPQANLIEKSSLCLRHAQSQRGDL
jgi:hypothetical protein